MKYSEGKIGRIFTLRLENGDKLPDIIEKFALEKKINSALVLYLGGANKTSKVVVGPKDNNSVSPIPMVTSLKGISESHGLGTIFLNEKKNRTIVMSHRGHYNRSFVQDLSR